MGVWLTRKDESRHEPLHNNEPAPLSETTAKNHPQSPIAPAATFLPPFATLPDDSVLRNMAPEDAAKLLLSQVDVEGFFKSVVDACLDERTITKIVDMLDQRARSDETTSPIPMFVEKMVKHLEARGLSRQPNQNGSSIGNTNEPASEATAGMAMPKLEEGTPSSLIATAMLAESTVVWENMKKNAMTSELGDRFVASLLQKLELRGLLPVSNQQVGPSGRCRRN